jgi:hypothetical protein
MDSALNIKVSVDYPGEESVFNVFCYGKAIFVWQEAPRKDVLHLSQQSGANIFFTNT